MSEPVIGEIRIFGFGFAPYGWAFCHGQIMPINQNQPLFSIIGTTYGGDGRTTFALPDLRGRTPIHRGRNGGSEHPLGQKGGREAYRLSADEMPQHRHELRASSADGDTFNTGDSVLARIPQGIYDQAGENLTEMRPGTITETGDGRGHENMQPCLAINFCIATSGLYPPQD